MNNTKHRWIGLATAGTILSSIVASACCWLPLVLLGFGMSSFGVAQIFETYRPHLLVATFAFLGLAFYLTYRREPVAPTCATDGEDQACCPPEGTVSGKLKKFNKVMLWPITVLVLVFAFFPSYIGIVLGQNPAIVETTGFEVTTFKVEGMTCAGCAITIEKHLGAVEGVKTATVDYESGLAKVEFDSTKLTATNICEEINKTGYVCKGQQQGG